ncbi:MAG: nucleotide exchange factor GrpE [Chloroflexi bacterium]|nr:nucleotide exchange factor GrpE [Chloroflexota bacterium]
MATEQEHIPGEQVAPAQEEGPAAERPVAELPVEELRQALAEERNKAERYLANWQRAQADFINYRRRTEQERTEQSKYAGAFLIVQLLPVLDDLERALNSVSATLAGFSWVDGIRLISRKLQMVLEAQGLAEVPAQGERFDPSVHEAVHFVEGEEGRVMSVIQKGYRLHDRVIRPALVVVGKGKPEAGSQETSGEPSTPSS